MGAKQCAAAQHEGSRGPAGSGAQGSRRGRATFSKQQRLAAAGLMPGDEAATETHLISAVPHPVSRVEAAEAEPGDFLRRGGATATRRAGSYCATVAVAAVLESWLLETLSIQHRNPVGVMHFRTWPQASRSGDTGGMRRRVAWQQSCGHRGETGRDWRGATRGRRCADDVVEGPRAAGLARIPAPADVAVGAGAAREGAGGGHGGEARKRVGVDEVSTVAALAWS